MTKNEKLVIAGVLLYLMWEQLPKGSADVKLTWTEPDFEQFNFHDGTL